MNNALQDAKELCEAILKDQLDFPNSEIVNVFVSKDQHTFKVPKQNSFMGVKNRFEKGVLKSDYQYKYDDTLFILERLGILKERNRSWRETLGVSPEKHLAMTRTGLFRICIDIPAAQEWVNSVAQIDLKSPQLISSTVEFINDTYRFVYPTLEVIVERGLPAKILDFSKSRKADKVFISLYYAYINGEVDFSISRIRALVFSRYGLNINKDTIQDQIGTIRKKILKAGLADKVILPESKNDIYHFEIIPIASK